MIFELLQVFIKTLTADHKDSVCYLWNLQLLYQMQLSKKLKTFSHLMKKSSSNLEHYEKKMTFTANVFPKL